MGVFEQKCAVVPVDKSVSQGGDKRKKGDERDKRGDEPIKKPYLSTRSFLCNGCSASCFPPSLRLFLLSNLLGHRYIFIYPRVALFNMPARLIEPQHLLNIHTLARQKSPRRSTRSPILKRCDAHRFRFSRACFGLIDSVEAIIRKLPGCRCFKILVFSKAAAVA